MYKEWNPSPAGAKVGDCAVRALAKAMDVDWGTAYGILCAKGFQMYDMPNSNSVINAVLLENGFIRHALPDTCPACYTVANFARDHRKGTYVLGTGDHVVAVSDGTVYDSWNSLNEIPIIYWQKGE